MPNLNGELLNAPTEPRMVTYLHEKAARLGTPLSGNFELTSRCNFNCKMCYIHSGNAGRRAEELSAGEWLEIGRQAAESGTAFLLLTGGEPLLREDFAEIYTGLKKHGFIISINTNGSLLCGDILELFKREPPSRLNISLYGGNDETYGELCENRCFTKVSENIKKAVEAGIQVKLNYSITPYNCGDMEEIYRFASEMKLHVQSSSYMYPQLRGGQTGCGENYGRFIPEQAAFYRAVSERMYSGDERFSEKARQIVSSIDGGKKRKKDRSMRCRAGRSNYWIDWRGNMSICGMIPAESGNVLQKGFSDCWETAKNAAKQVVLPQKCADCKFAPLCNVCAAVCKCETGSFDSVPEYMCRYSREYYRIIREECNDLL